MTLVPCSCVDFAKETELELAEWNNKRNVSIQKAESFLDMARSVRAPHHLEHIRLSYVCQLEMVLEMVCLVDKCTTENSGHLNECETYLNDIDKHGSRLLKFMQMVDKPCGFRR